MTVRATKADVIAAGFCDSGMRHWCRLHGFTSRDVADGIPVQTMLDTGCDLAAQVVAKAMIRHEKQMMGAQDGDR